MVRFNALHLEEKIIGFFCTLAAFFEVTKVLTNVKNLRKGNVNDGSNQKSYLIMNRVAV